MGESSRQHDPGLARRPKPQQATNLDAEAHLHQEQHASFVKKTWFGSPSSSNVKKGPTKSHMARGSSPLPLKDSTPQIRGNDAAVTSASKRRRIHQEGREASSSKPRRCAADAHARTPRGILGRRGVAAAVRFMGAARFVHAGRPGDGAAPPPPAVPRQAACRLQDARSRNGHGILRSLADLGWHIMQRTHTPCARGRTRRPRHNTCASHALSLYKVVWMHPYTCIHTHAL